MKSPGSKRALTRAATSALNVGKKGLAFMNKQDVELMLRVQHSKGDGSPPDSYEVPVAVDPKRQSIKLKNTHFFCRDRSRRVALFGYFLSIFKFLVFYLSVAGMMALPTERGVQTATNFFVIPAIFKSVVGYLEKLKKLFDQLRELGGYQKALKGKFLVLTSLAKLLQKAQKAECPYLPFDSFISGFTKTAKATYDKGEAVKPQWETAPSQLFLSWIYSAKTELGADITDEDVYSMRFVIEEKLLGGAKAQRLKVAGGGLMAAFKKKTAKVAVDPAEGS
jgi:hypothetical protein